MKRLRFRNTFLASSFLKSAASGASKPAPGPFVTTAPWVQCRRFSLSANRVFQVEPFGPSEIRVQVGASVDMYPSLKELTAVAGDGDIIELAPGRYVGGLDIHKELELRGMGDPANGAVELAGCHRTDWVVRSSRKGIRLVNISILGFWKRKPSIVLSGGKSLIERCHVVGGLRMDGRSRGEVLINRVRGGNLPSIILIDEASPHIMGNEVTGGAEAGIYIGGHAFPMVEENDIYGNAEAGVLVVGSSVPVLYANHIHSNHGHGVRVEGEACPNVEENEVHDNNDSNICVADKSAPVISNNKIHHSSQYGVSCMHESAPIIKNNEIYANYKPGIRIGPAATAFIRGGNNMYGNGEDQDTYSGS